MNYPQTVVRWGATGRPLVFLHYFGGAASSWQWVAQELDSDYQCIALNLPGFGGTQPLENPSIDSFTNWIAQTLKQLSLPNPVLIGHSMSGKLALSVAAEYPNLVSSIILVAPSPPTHEPMEEEERQRMLNHPNESEAETTVEQSSNLKLKPVQKSLAIRTQLMVDHQTWKWWLFEGTNHSISDKLGQISIPVHLLASSDDPNIPIEFLKNDLKQLTQDIEEVVTQDVGHLLPLETPGWVAKHIRQFVDVS